MSESIRALQSATTVPDKLGKKAKANKWKFDDFVDVHALNMEGFFN